MAYEKKTWVNVPDPDSYIGDIPLSDLPRFDADNMNRIEEGIENSLKLEDGYVAEILKIKSDNMPKVQITAPNNFSEIVKNADDNGDFGLVLNDYSDKSDTDSKIALSLCHKLANESIDGALRLINRYPGGSKVYKIYGEHNKPTTDDIGALSKTTVLNGVDILTVSKEGWYYTHDCTNVPIKANGYMRVMSCDDKYRTVEWMSIGSCVQYLNVLKNGQWLGWVEMVHNDNLSRLGVAKIQTGTYTGTGVDKDGYAYPVNLSFNFIPKCVFVQGHNDEYSGIDNGVYGYFWYNEKFPAIFYSSGASTVTATWGDKTLEWKSSNKASVNVVLNNANTRYSWIAIG